MTTYLLTVVLLGQCARGQCFVPPQPPPQPQQWVQPPQFLEEDDGLQELREEVEELKDEVDAWEPEDIAAMSEEERTKYFATKREYRRKARELRDAERQVLVDARKQYYAQMAASARRERLANRQYYDTAGANMAALQGMVQQEAYRRFFTGNPYPYNYGYTGCGYYRRPTYYYGGGYPSLGLGLQQ